jgi:hypothetical protein
MNVWPKNVDDLPEVHPVNVSFSKIITTREYLFGVIFEDKSPNAVIHSVTTLTALARFSK